MDRTDWIGDLYTSTFGWELLEALADGGPRLAASDGERRAHDRVLEAFREAGLRNLGEHTFEMPAWERDSATLAVDQPQSLELDCIALPGSPPADLSSEIVHLGYGLPEDFEAVDLTDKIVVATSDVPDWYDHWMHRREKYGLAIDHGAAAFVYANHVEGCLPPTGSLGGGMDVIGEIPAIGVSREVGARLERLARADDFRGHLEVDVAIDPNATSQNVYGELGPETDEHVIVGAHVDGHDISQAAIDNGAGVAILCDVARTLADREHDLDIRVRFVGFGSEELGLNGSQHYALDHDLSDVRIVLNLDGIGQGRDLQVHDNLFDGVAPVVDRVADQFQHPVETLPEYVVHSDHWPFVWKGVPGVMVTAESDDKGRGFGHTFADTLEKVDIRALRDHAIVATQLVVEMARSSVDIPRRTRQEVEQDLRQRGHESRLRLAGDWPFD
jgi:Zn-dependent M28 family amino/carboxypeptidase